jgi:hypothetical protein
MSNLSQLVLKAVGRHFVSLSCVQLLPDGKKKAQVFSGFLVDVRGVWIYVTAGHILRDIRLSLAAGGGFDAWRLDDTSAGNRFKGAAIPFAFDLDRWVVIEQEEIGLDYAVVVLGDLYRRSLAAGGAVPIDKLAWGDHVSEHDHWALVGIPSESVAYDEKSIITSRLVITPIEEVAAPAVAGRKAENQFFGRLKSDASDPAMVKNIDGMSGGPIFALKKVEGAWKYTVIGVQSAWYEASRIVAACPFSSLGFALEEAADLAIDSMGGSHSEPREE